MVVKPCLCSKLAEPLPPPGRGRPRTLTLSDTATFGLGPGRGFRRHRDPLRGSRDECQLAHIGEQTKTTEEYGGCPWQFSLQTLAELFRLPRPSPPQWNPISWPTNQAQPFERPNASKPAQSGTRQNER